MIFQDRKDAGEQLAELLNEYKKMNPLVLGIPRGGIEIGYYVALNLKAELSVLVSKRLAYPGHEEYDFGAVCEKDVIYIREKKHRLSDEVIQRVLQKSKKEIEHGITIFRNGIPLPELSDRTIIITDDGIATGTTLIPAIRLCRTLKAARIIVAVPVAGKLFDKSLIEADEVKILHQTESHKNITLAYKTFKRLDDDEALAFIKNYPVSLS
jgi:putative phosphoribosyl transferase